MFTRARATAHRLVSVATTRAFGAAAAIATAIAPEPVPTSTTRALRDREPRTRSVAATSCSLAPRGVITSPGRAANERPLKMTWSTVGDGGLQRLLAADERAQALVLVAAGGAAEQMGAQPGDRGVGVGTGELQLDVAVELLEALVAADFGLRRPEQPAQRLLQIGSLGHFVSSSVFRDRPCSSRWDLSFRRASCSVL